MNGHEHFCDEDGCLCPVHETAMYYWPEGRVHACQDMDCEHGRGLDPDALHAKQVMDAYRRYKDQQELERQAQQAQRALEAQLWSQYVWSTPDSWQLIPSPMWQHVKDWHDRWRRPTIPLWRLDGPGENG